MLYVVRAVDNVGRLSFSVLSGLRLRLKTRRTTSMSRQNNGYKLQYIYILYNSQNISQCLFLVVVGSGGSLSLAFW